MRTVSVCAVACLVGSVAAYAQSDPTLIPSTIALNPTQMFGMVGVALNQTARLNVVNVTGPPVVAGAVPLVCRLTLQFFDDQNTKVAELAVDSLDPGKATHLDYARPAATATAVPARVQVRAVVVNTSAVTGVPQPGAPTIQVVSPCTVLPTVEVFDNDTGKTQVFMSGPSFTPSLVLTPAQ